MRRLADVNKTALTLTLCASGFAAFVARHLIKFQILAVAFALVLGLIGWNQTRPPKDTWDYFDNVFRTLQLITLQFPNDATVRASALLQIARILIPLVTVFASFQIFLASITRPLRMALLPYTYDHIVVSGPARFSQGAIAALARGGQQVVLASADIPSSQRDALEGLGLTVLDADIGQPSSLSALHVSEAAAVLLLRENDTDNLNVALRLLSAQLKRRLSSPLLLGVRIENEALAAEMEFTLDSMAKHRRMRYQRLAPVRESLRVELARSAPVFQKARGAVSHIMIIGLQPQWQQVVSELIIWLQDHPTKLGFLTFLVDSNEESSLRKWLERHPELGLILRHAIFGCDDNVPASDILDECCRQYGAPHLIVILQEDAVALTTVLTLRGSPSLRHSKGAMLVQQSREDFFLSSLNEMQELRGSQWTVAAIGGLIREESINRLLDRDQESAAMALHEEYRASGLARGPADVSWDELQESLCEANRAAIRHAPVLIASLRLDAEGGEATSSVCDLSQSEAMARVEHRRWIAHLIDRGWRYGSKHDALLRTHPSMVPFEDLNENDKQKACHTALAIIRSWEKRPSRKTQLAEPESARA